MYATWRLGLGPSDSELHIGKDISIPTITVLFGVSAGLVVCLGPRHRGSPIKLRVLTPWAVYVVAMGTSLFFHHPTRLGLGYLVGTVVFPVSAVAIARWNSFGLREAQIWVRLGGAVSLLLIVFSAIQGRTVLVDALPIDPNLAAMVLLPVVALGLALYVGHRDRPAFIAAIFAAAVLVSSGRRTAFAAIVLITLILVIRMRALSLPRLTALSFIAALAISAVIMIRPSGIDDFLVRLKETTGAYNVTTARLEDRRRAVLWTQAADIARDHAPMGVGFGQYLNELERRSAPEWTRARPHNIALIHLAEVGLWGTPLIILALATPLIALWRTANDPLEHGLVAALAGAYLMLLSNDYLYSPGIWLPLTAVLSRLNVAVSNTHGPTASDVNGVPTRPTA